MAATSRANRAKLSTTVASETYAFLEQMIKTGEAATLAEAIDSVISRFRKLENRRRLAAATTRYFDELDASAQAEENALAKAMTSGARTIDFDREI